MKKCVVRLNDEVDSTSLYHCNGIADASLLFFDGNSFLRAYFSLVARVEGKVEGYVVVSIQSAQSKRI